MLIKHKLFSPVGTSHAHMDHGMVVDVLHYMCVEETLGICNRECLTCCKV